MKRFISIAMICFIFVISLSPSASASEMDDIYINVLDYATADNSGLNQFGSNGGYTASAVYDIPFRPYVRYVDLIVVSANGDPSSASLNGYALNISKIGNRLFRVYGSFSVTGKVLTISFSSSTAGVTYNILSFKAGSYASLNYAETGFLAVGTSYWSSSYSYMSDADSPATVYIDDTSAEPLNANFTSYIYPQNYELYDYMDLSIKIHATAITSISAKFDDYSIPFTVSYCDLSSGDWVSYDTDSGHGIIVTNEIDTVLIMIQLDLTAIPKTGSTYPQIAITGQYLENNVNNYVSLLSVVGRLYYEAPSPLYSHFHNLRKLLSLSFSALGETIDVNFDDLNSWIVSQTEAFETAISSHTSAVKSQFTALRTALSTHFSNLNSWIDSQTDTLEAAIRGDTSSGDSFQDDVDDKDQQLDDMADVMDSVNKPSLDSVNVNVNQYVSASDLASLTSPLLVLLTGDVFGTIFIMTIILATVSYVLYGKR